MPTRIVHLSDLHYGGSFDLATWNSVVTAVTDFQPHLLIVSGDLVDDPSEAQLRTVKQVLDDLAATVGAELFVAPGNHDVSPFGIHWNVQLFVYEPGRLALRSVASRSSKPSKDGSQECFVGLGDGIVGAAFVRRAIVPWAADDVERASCKPVPEENPDGDWQTIVAVPVFHPWEQQKESPSLWGGIGVVCVSLSSPASRILELLNDVLLPEEEEMASRLRMLTHIRVHEMITELNGSVL
ncbi:MAG: metallophosphoesterase [Alphaproteobacteria bacterium]|nr:metallophosphoesterase [Alphaproteobacteria bacterium]